MEELGNDLGAGGLRSVLLQNLDKAPSFPRVSHLAYTSGHSSSSRIRAPSPTLMAGRGTWRQIWKRLVPCRGNMSSIFVGPCDKDADGEGCSRRWIRICLYANLVGGHARVGVLSCPSEVLLALLDKQS